MSTTRFDEHRTDTRARASELRVLAAALLTVTLLQTSVRAAGDGSEESSGGARWGANYFPNVPLITQEGKTVRFFNDLLRDKVVVINFIYTSCPDVCPLETSRLAELQGILADRVGRDVFMYSISIDPEHDTPEVLAEYAARFGAGPGWLFLTGKKEDITLVRRKLSLYREKKDQGSTDHNTSLIIGNQKTGRWMKSGPYENPYFLANQVGSWLSNWKEAAPNQDSYANAPQLRQLSQGESLFRQRCSSCHIIGERWLVPESQSARLLGPDLAGVLERRDRDWLARWLEKPNELLAQGDPIALELFERHGKVAMPNLSLDEADVNALLEFIESESRRVAAEEQFAGARPAAEPGERPACCHKNEAPVLSAGEATPPPAVSTREAKAGGTGKSPATAAVFSTFGLGWVFLGLAAVVGRRRSPAPAPAPVPQR
jgi:protein SCO1/2